MKEGTCTFMNTSAASPAAPHHTAVNLADYAACAESVLDAAAWAYLSGGAGDEQTLRANVLAWQRIGLLPRLLQPLAHGHTRLHLFGREWAHPIWLAPVAYQALFHPQAELASAVAAAAQGAGLVLSTLSTTPLETVAQAIADDAARGPLWFQLYLQGDRGADAELIARAEAAGYEALVLTADAPCHGARDRERRAGFALPPGVQAAHRRPATATPALLPPGASALFDRLLLRAPNWDDVAWLRAQTRLPILLKGVLHADDARQARSLGLDGAIVSNHGGRTLDTLPPTAERLRHVVDAVGADWPVLVDGGIRRGTDVAKALALGARAVLIGRPYVCALSAAGPQGVAHVIRLLRDELEIAMALLGARTPQDLARTHLLEPASTLDSR